MHFINFRLYYIFILFYCQYIFEISLRNPFFTENQDCNGESKIKSIKANGNLSSPVQAVLKNGALPERIAVFAQKPPQKLSKKIKKSPKPYDSAAGAVFI